MYLGQIVEKCAAEEFFKATIHPYSQALLSAILLPDIDVERKRIILKGELASPINPGKLCRFAPRCIYADDECFESCPDLHDIGGGHLVRCHKVTKTKTCSKLNESHNMH
jgi:peptide/nickel transport system ATP-binding protein